MENVNETSKTSAASVVYSAYVGFRGMKKRQRKVQYNLENLGDFEVSEDGIERAREAAMQWIKDNVKQSGSIDLVLRRCKLDGYLRTWEVFGKDNVRIHLGSLERINIKEELKKEVCNG